MALRPGRLVRATSPELLLGGLVFTTLLAVTVAAAGVVVATTAALGGLPSSVGTATVLVLFAMALGLATTSALLAMGLAWRALAGLRAAVEAGRRRVLWRLYREARALETKTSLGRLLRPARFFQREGPAEGPLVEELKARYVAGELDEREFERELSRLLGGGVSTARELRRELEVAGDGNERVAEPEPE